LKQSEHTVAQVPQAATGNREALTELMLAHGPAVRVMLAAHLEAFAAIAPLELAVWSAVHARLGDYNAAQPFSGWVKVLAEEPLRAHLTQVSQRALVVQDVTTHHLAQESLAALVDGRELGALTLTAQSGTWPENVRALLIAHYRDRQSLGVIAAAQGVDEATLANALVAARARCDWRALAKPPAASDRDLPPLIEDLLNGIIDNASRGLLADYLTRAPAHVQQVARQVRIHVVCRVLFLPFTRSHAVALAQQVVAGDTRAGRVATCAPVQIPVVPRRIISEPTRAIPASESGTRVIRPSPAASGLSARPTLELDDDGPTRPVRRRSFLPYVIAGGLVVVGVIAVLLSSRAGGRPSSSPPAPTALTAVLPAVDQPDTTPPSAPPAIPDPVRPPVPSAPTTSPLQVTLVGVVADSHPYAGQAVALRGALSSTADLARVEFWNGENKLGEATSAPWAFTWTPTAGAFALTARAITSAGDSTTSPVITLTAVTTYGSGSLRREWWTGIPGDRLKDLDRIPGFPARPQGHALVDQFATPSNWGNDYLQRVWGFVIPPLDGEYVFWIAADDDAELWLSSDDRAATRQRVAVSKQIPGSGTKPMEWDRQPGQRSAPLRLQAGRRYLIEALHKEGGGDDHVEVGWRLPDQTLERPIPGFHLSSPADAVPTSPDTPPDAPTTVTIAPPPPPTWTVVRAINLGGDSVEIDGVRWLGHRQAEAEGATPVNSHQPGPWLSDVPWARATNGNGPVRRDRSTTERPLSVDGKVYAKGLGAHSTSEVVYALEPQWTAFSALVGVDDVADGAKAEVVFQVWLDGQKVWDSGPVRKGTAKPVVVPLAGRKELRLVVEPSGPGDWDHADWANAQFMRVGGGDGTLQIKTGKRSVAGYTPKPAVDAKMRSLLTTALTGSSKDGLEFSVRVPNGPLRIWLLMGESGTANSRQFDLEVEGVALPVAGLSAAAWQKLGPVDVVVADEAVTVKATPIKGTPQLMGFLAERPEFHLSAPLLSASDPLTVIPDAVGYQQIYQADLAKLAKEVPYEVDNTRMFAGTFTRIAYLLELQAANQPLRWVWTSMDAFTKEVRLIGVPTVASGAFFQQTVANLLVASNVDGLPVGAVGDGVIEFWPSNYGGKNQAGIAGATDELDFGDQPAARQDDGYGSMQVHNLAARQTVWALNHWVVGNKADLGIGPSPSGGDWTFATNGDGYVLKRLRVFVKPTP
jgi:NPCBM/NEW2 domain/PA14 domain/Bacterial Ig domain